MSDVGKIAKKAVGTAAGFFLGGPAGAAVGAGLVGRAAKSALKSKRPAAPQIPTLDTAAQNQQVTDRIRMRRGVLSTIYGGASNSTPAVATKQLLGS